MLRKLNTLSLILLFAVSSCAKSPSRHAVIASSTSSPLMGEGVGGGEKKGQGEGASSLVPPPSSFMISTPRIYFPFDSDSILSDAADEINQNISWLGENPETYIILEGHCDEVGPFSYNMELGDRRARAVKAYMMERGIPHERVIMIVSYGSTKPLNPGHRIEDLRENRRVEFVIR